TLGKNGGAIQATTLPADTRQLGVWLKFADVRGPVVVSVNLSDSTARNATISLAFVKPGDPATQGWRFFAADLQRAVGRFGNELRDAQLQQPITLHSIFVSSTSRIAIQRGSLLIGPMLATTQAPPAAPGISGEALARDLA